MNRTNVKASLLAIAALMAPVHANAQAVFSQVSGWTINEAPFNVSGGAKSCTAMTRFDNGFSMQMTGSASGIRNLSIDFRQPAFQAGGIMDARLEFPGISPVQVPAQAFGNNLLVMNMDGQVLPAAMRNGGPL